MNHPPDGADPIAFVLSANEMRRHDDISQRGLTAGRLANLGHGGDRKSDQAAPVHLEMPFITEAPRVAPPAFITIARAAELMDVSPRTVANAKVVLDHGIPDLVEKVEAGEIPITAAAVIAKQPQEEQPAAIVAHNHRAQGTGENEWYTPAVYIEAARAVMGGIDLDPASSEIANETVKAARFFDLNADGLAQEWHGAIYLNPPYSQPHIRMFCEKLVAEYDAGRVAEAIALTHNYTDTAWFHTLASNASAVCFTRGRIGFLDPVGKKAAPTQGQAFSYFGKSVAAFAERFREFGIVLVRHEF